jgi:hypothetical protein
MPALKQGLGPFFPRQWALIIAVCVGSGLAHVGTSTMPFQVGALIDGTGLTSSQAGLFAFCQVGALAIGMILVSPWIDRVQPTAVCIGSALLSAGASLGLFFVHAFALQLVLGTFTGLGFGFVFAATIAGAATQPDAGRLYAVGNGGALLLIMAIVATLPIAIARMGSMGVFVEVAALSVSSTIFFFGFRRGEIPERIRIAAWRNRGAPALIFSWAAFSIGTGATYAFSERIGTGLRLSPQSIGLVLSTGVFVGVLGTVIAALPGSDKNRRKALLGGIIGTGLSCLLLGYSMNLATFAAGIFSYWIFYMFTYSCLLGTAARLDPTGRVGALGGGTERLGYGVGAWIGGVLATHTGYAAIGAFGFGGCVIGIIFGYPSLSRALQATGEKSRDSDLNTVIPTRDRKLAD